MPFSFDCSDPVERESGLSSATRAVQSGQLVVLPTDTVYGIGADAFDAEAVANVLAAKGRSRTMPVPVLVGSWDTLDGLVSFVPERVRNLVEAFWPGGLTLIVEHAPSLSWDLGETRGTVGVRMPLHPVALELLAQTGPMAVSSANKSGHPPAATCDEAMEQLGDDVNVYLDGGPVPPSPAGVVTASTIVDVTGEVPRVLRVGAITVEQLRTVLPDVAG